MRLAQVLSRAGDFDRALLGTGQLPQTEPESKVASRIEQKLFASGMDPVENVITERMTATHLPIDLIGAAIQMWMELRISLGRSHPRYLCQARGMGSRGGLYGAQGEPPRREKLEELANTYETSAETIRKHHETLVTRLDIMP